MAIDDASGVAVPNAVDEIRPTGTIALPSGFRFDEVPPSPRLSGAPAAAPSLGPLAAFVGNWSGNGFNTIFRPESSATPTPLQNPVPPGSDNILELNLTFETLAFSPSLGTVPNRGMVQGDIFLNGVPYLQTVSDVTGTKSVGIHVEPGIWMIVPSTTDPAEGATLVRMASIPHGTTIEAQGTWSTFVGAPTIPAVSITPQNGSFRFASQTASDPNTPRIPQDLSTLISEGRITQALLDDPNTLLRNHNSGLKITSTTQIFVTTNPNVAPPSPNGAGPVFGGGTDNIAFLLGNAAATSPNADATQMAATFWIETVEHTIIVPVFKPGQPPLTIKPEASVPGQPTPSFTVRPPVELSAPRTITVTSKQIQYSQVVILNFNGLIWPHVSVATLVPAGKIAVPPGAW